MTGESMIYVLNKSKTCERFKKSFNIVMLEEIKGITFLSFKISPCLHSLATYPSAMIL